MAQSQGALVYLGLGGNSEHSILLLQEALNRIGALPRLQALECSRFYRTTPVSSISQNLFVNAVCCFRTLLTPKALLTELQRIETHLGKVPKPKDSPRPIDIDILFYGSQSVKESDLEIPHPRWQERLFVLAPLSDLAHEIELPNNQIFNIAEYLGCFPNIHNERVQLI